MEKLNTLSEKQLTFIAENSSLLHDQNGELILSEKHEKEFMAFMFGEEFIASKTKGEKVTY